MPDRERLMERLRHRYALSQEERQEIINLLTSDAAVLEGIGTLIQAVDDLFTYLMESGLVEEGGGLKLYEAMKPLADARSQVATLDQEGESGGD